VPEAVPTPAPCPLGLTDPSGTGEICLAGAGAIAFTSFPFALSWQQNMFQCQTLSQALFFKHIALEHEGACTAHLPKVSWTFIFPTILSMQVSEDIAKNLPMNGICITMGTLMELGWTSPYSLCDKVGLMDAM